MDPDALGRAVALASRIVASPHTAGLLGSLLSLYLAGCGLGAKSFAFVCGVAAWLYGAPMLTAWLGLQTEYAPNFVALLSGLFGGKAVARAAEVFDTIDWPAVVGKFLPGVKR